MPDRIFLDTNIMLYAKMMNDNEKKEAAIRLMAELENGRVSGEKEGWQTLEEVRNGFGIGNA